MIYGRENPRRQEHPANRRNRARSAVLDVPKAYFFEPRLKLGARGEAPAENRVEEVRAIAFLNGDRGMLGKVWCQSPQ
jgi:hypothetical protein